MRLQLAVSLLAILFKSSSCLTRPRRVINGKEFDGRPRQYEAIRYYGALATAHRTVSLGWGPFRTVYTSGYVKCSGSLLTTSIFQTACHCVADFDLQLKEKHRPAQVQNAFENRNVVYLGTNDRRGGNSFESYSYVTTEKYFVHQKCTDISHGLMKRAFPTHDYALVRLDNSWLNQGTFPRNEITYAPQYTVQEIKAFFNYAMEKEVVCLILGFGDYTLLENGPDTTVMRHGWTALTPLMDCYFVIKRPLLNQLDMDDFSWVCSKEFPQNPFYIGTGDSGGPVTCGNAYFAIVSASIRAPSRLPGILTYSDSLYAPLAYDLFASAVNYRESLGRQIHNFGNTYDSIKVTEGDVNFGREGSTPGSKKFYHQTISVGLTAGPKASLLTLACVYNF